MTEPRHFIIRKNSTTHWVVFSAVVGITCLIALCVNLFTDRSPMEFLSGYFLFFGFAFIILALYIQHAEKRTLILDKNENGYPEIRIVKKDMIEFEHNGYFEIEAVVMQVPTGGKGLMATMPEQYVNLYVEPGKPILSLKDNPGKLATVSADFHKVQLGTVKVTNVHTCRNVDVVLTALKELRGNVE